ncbi:Uncharacterised protein [Enterobacter hormaechei]|nr:hypothetical protein L463_00836 [Enterobacter sp. BIDMC 27]KLW66429.1 hypothetical protein SK60_04588 [Enterobacter sp. BIDMC99]CZW03535.1 Uncharacterised protein [Enterobacter hormaechei]BBW29122.1 hypothetical protein STN0717ENT60_00450 [Enterobacter cloacae]CZW36014.1 Uncharacterised protein [Enterobacter hormaechei]
MRIFFNSLIFISYFYIAKIIRTSVIICNYHMECCTKGEIIPIINS